MPWRNGISAARAAPSKRAAQAANNAGAVTQLNALTASDLGNLAKLDIVFRWQAPFIGPDRAYLDMQGAALAKAARPLLPADDYYRARLACVGKLMPSVLDYDARTAGMDLPVPFFVIQGRDDNRTPPETARAFAGQVRAPAKTYTEIEGGHFACFTNPAGFLDALESDLRTIRPDR
jgi:pimeloyl-ACP methyl ester carboxylesterase